MGSLGLLESHGPERSTPSPSNCSSGVGSRSRATSVPRAGLLDSHPYRQQNDWFLRVWYIHVSKKSHYKANDNTHFYTSDIHSVYRAHVMVSSWRHGLQEANAVCTSVHHPLLTKVWQRRDGWVSMALRGELSLDPSTHVKSRCVNTCLWSQNQENKDKRTPRLAGQPV